LIISAGAAVSVVFTLYAGRRNSSVLLIALFIVWVASPFGGLAWMERATPRPGFPWFALLISAASPVLYGYIALGPPRKHTAFTFLILPLASWLLIAVTAALGKRATRT
jgi:hypothetical protein